MSERLRRPRLRLCVSALLAATIVAFTLGSSSHPRLIEIGQTLRWAALFVLAALSVAYAVRKRPLRLPVNMPYALVATLVVLGGVSSLWSVEPRLTAARTGTFAILALTAGSLAIATAGRPRAIRSIVLGILAGALLVMIGGVAVFILEPDYAMQWAGTDSPARFRGLGQNPNTVPMLAALALPLAAWLLAESRRSGRALALVCLVAFYGTIVASDSRGALLAATAGLVLTLPLLASGWRRRLAAELVVVAGLVVAVAASELRPLPGLPPLLTASPAAPTPAPEIPPAALPIIEVRPQDEIGHPAFGAAGDSSRTLLGGSGRLQAWEGALEQAGKRPVLGYGFGTEDRVFVDRYYVFEGGHAENSYLGIFLQLGAAGVFLLLAIGASLALTAARALRRLGAPERGLVSAFAGVVLAGFVIALFQSYVYSVGNIATVTFWTSAFLLYAVSAARVPVPRSEGSSTRLGLPRESATPALAGSATRSDDA